MGEILGKDKGKSRRGFTPLHCACYYGHTDAVAALLKAGASVEPVGPKDITPFMLAVRRGKIGLVR